MAGQRSERVREVIERGEPIRVTDERDGGWFESSLYPIFDSRGRVSRFVIYSLDITDRRRAEEALRQSEALLKSVFQAAPIGIGLVYNRVLGWTNDQVARMLGYSIEELAEKSARILYESDEEFERVGREKYIEVRQGGTGALETQWKHRDGRLLDIMLSSRAIDPADIPAGVVFTALDITDRKRTEEALQRYQDELEQQVDPKATVGRLPIGARQVVEICRAIAARARVVLMDEPTSSLPRGDVDRLFATIGRMSAAGVAVVYISHFLEETRAVASAFTVLRDGRTVGTGALASVTNDELIALMVGRTVGELFPRRERRPSDRVALEVSGLAAPGLHEASFSLRRGEVLGVFGLMGSGRTEMVRALFGLARPAAGRVRVGGGEGPLDAAPARRLLDGLGYLSEDRKGEGLALPLSVADNVTATRLRSCSRRGVIDTALQRRQAGERAGELHVRMGAPDQAVRTLSGGNQQKVAFARLVHQEADVLLLDEPTRGVDVGSKAQIYEAVARAADAGKGVLMVSSYLPELLGVCDRLAVMSRGRLGPVRPVASWTPETVLEAAIGA